MIDPRAASQRVRMCTVDPVSGYDSPSISARASSPSRCSALSLRSAISGTPWPVSAIMAATAAVRSAVMALAWIGRLTVSSCSSRAVSPGVRW